MAYSISTAFAIYFVLWWIVLFLTLPFGVRCRVIADHRPRIVIEEAAVA